MNQVYSFLGVYALCLCHPLVVVHNAALQPTIIPWMERWRRYLVALHAQQGPQSFVSSNIHIPVLAAGHYHASKPVVLHLLFNATAAIVGTVDVRWNCLEIQVMQQGVCESRNQWMSIYRHATVTFLFHTLFLTLTNLDGTNCFVSSGNISL